MKIKSKKGIAVIVGTVILLIIFLLCNQYQRRQEETRRKEEVANYVGEYLANTSVSELFLEEDMEMISEKISTGIINSMSEESLSEKEYAQLHTYVLQTVQEQLAALEEESEEFDGQAMKQEILGYIDNTVVPDMANQLQLTNGNINNLSDSFSAAQNEYQNDKEASESRLDALDGRLAAMESNAASKNDLQDVQDNVDSIGSQLGEYSIFVEQSLNGVTLYVEEGELYGKWTDEEGNVISKKLDFAQ